MNNQPINQQNQDDLPKAQDVKKANKPENILYIVVMVALILGLITSEADISVVFNLIGIVSGVVLFVKKFSNSKKK